MKLKITCLLLVVCVTSLCCMVHKGKDYVIPDNVPVEARDETIKTVERGIALYEKHCTSCHGAFTKKKDRKLERTDEQLMKYTQRYMTSDAVNHKIALEIGPTDLGEILTYLRYRFVKLGGKDVLGIGL